MAVLLLLLLPQDVIRRYKEAHPGNWDLLPERVAFQVSVRSLHVAALCLFDCPMAVRSRHGQ